MMLEALKKVVNSTKKNHFSFYRFWSDRTEQRPPPKSQGAIVMTSDFFTQFYFGTYQARKAGRILMSKDGYSYKSLCPDDFK